jgi:hypothetical protein
MKNIFVFLFVSILSVGMCYSQSTLNVAGTQQNNVSWSIGELLTTTGTTNNTVVYQGFNQQAGDVISSVKQLLNTSYSIYPNPVTDKLNVKIEGNSLYSWTLTDLTGRVVKSRSSCLDMGIDVAELVSGQYILNLTTDGNKISAIIIKK